MIFRLFKIFASNIFSFSFFIDGIKKGWKGIVKTVLLSILLLTCYGMMIFAYGATMYSTYKNMASSGYANLMPLVSILVSFCIILFFGITSVTSNYFTGSGEEQIISMPITSTQFFGAKFCVSFLTDAIIGFVLFAISSFIYGYNEHLLKNPLFYLGFLVTDITLSIFSIALIYFLLILLLLICPALRKRKFLTSIASFLIIIFALAYGMLSSRLTEVMGGNFEQMSSVSSPLKDFAIDIGNKSPFLYFAADALNGKLLPIFIMTVLSSILIFVFIPLMGKLYIKTLNGFSDIKTKKLSSEKIEETLHKKSHRQSVFKALYIRDVRTVFREPTFFTNGPLMVFLFPIIIVISMAMGVINSSSGDLTSLIMKIRITVSEMSLDEYNDLKYYITLIISGLAYFSGNLSSIASSSFSREGKSLYDLKAMPIENRTIAKVKLFHALTYVFIGWGTISLILAIINVVIGFPFSAGALIGMVLYALIMLLPISILIIFIDMFIDTAKPKLQWENPIAAFKQNMNSLAAIFIAFAILFIVIVLFVFLLPKKETAFIIVAVIFTVISAPIGSLYFKYAEKRITNM